LVERAVEPAAAGEASNWLVRLTVMKRAREAKDPDARRLYA